LRPTWNDDARKLLLTPRHCGVSFSPTYLVKKWRIANPKMIFAKNQEVYFLALKCKTTPVPAKSTEIYVKFKNNLQRLSQWNESWYAYPRWSNIYVWCFSQLLISRFRSRFTKKPYFGTPKMEKTLIVGPNENRPPWRSSPSRRPHACPIWPRSDKLCHAQSQI
jgi:hypothetical protein